ncbi:MAG TPA: alpha/beta hydrolase [Candidatus Nanopelagicales bacterium]|nr:alpha/beta hydrolase [Candidatus Nanopelagicales bacterium]
MKFDDFAHVRVQANGVDMHCRVGGEGPAVVLLHGFPQHSLMWHGVAPILAERRTVIAPDLRGVGGTSIPRGGYDKKTMAADVKELLRALGHERAAIVGYDLGAGVAYSFAASSPEATEKLALIEMGLPGFGYEYVMTPNATWNPGSNWHLALFTVPEVAEWLLRGKEREMLAWFFWHISENPSAISPEHFEEYARQISRPGVLRAGIEYYAACFQDADDNRRFAERKLTMPALGVGGRRSAGDFVGQMLKELCEDVQTAIIDGAGHWVADEQPARLAEVLGQFLDG